MSSSINYLNFILDQLIELDGVSYKKMMGEYLLYYQGKLFGGIYDDRMLVKIVDTNKKYNMEKALPYDGAKEMFLVDSVDDRDLLKEIVLNTCVGL